MKAHIEIHGADATKKVIIEVLEPTQVRQLKHLALQAAARTLHDTGHVHTITVALKFEIQA